jgi:uncharacterized membrane protein
MSLNFSNNYTAEVSIAIMWYTPNCPDGGDWSKAGWYNLAPGQFMTVFNGDLDEINRYWCYYAEASDGAFWAGDVVTQIPDRAFDWCINTGSSDSREIGFRVLDIDSNDDFTLNLVPLGS